MVIFHKRGFDSYLDDWNYKRQSIGVIWLRNLMGGYCKYSGVWRHQYQRDEDLGLWVRDEKWVSGFIASCHDHWKGVIW